jgi:hypothetical protein
MQGLHYIGKERSLENLVTIWFWYDNQLESALWSSDYSLISEPDSFD